MKDKLIAELTQYFNVLDIVAILVTYSFTQRIKSVVVDKWRPLVAIGVGFLISAGFATVTGGWRLVIFFGLIYGGGAILLYEAGFNTVIVKVSDWVKGKMK